MAISKRDLSALSDQSFDVVIIGGGISGAWLALHCVQQGHKTALIEKHDYASRTSGASSKILHGGIRYLQQMQFNKVRESAIERAHYLYAAPHLSTPVPFVIPTYRDFQRSKFFLNCGMIAYRLLCIGENRVIDSKEQNLPPIRSVSADQLNDICNLGSEEHTGAVVFYERHMLDSERMVLAIIQTARQLGAQISNYVSADGFIQSEGTVIGLNAKDELSGERLIINSKLVINAAGPWVDNLNSTLENSARAPSINGFAVGSHIITRQLCDHAIALTTKHQSDAKIDRGGRHVFVIPWRGYSLIGTSYDEIDSPNDKLCIKAGHVEQLIEAVNDNMPGANLTRADLVSGYSGLYPLQTNNIKNTVYQGSGEYQIIDHKAANNIDGIITALGAKFTTGRKLSELTMKVVADKLGCASIKPAKTKLHGSDYSSLRRFTTNKQKQYKGRFSEQEIKHFVVHYGSEVDAFISSLTNDQLTAKICVGHLDIMGQVVWAVEHEQAVALDDVLFNRTSLGLLGISSAEAEKVAALMADQLGWSEEEYESQLKHVINRLNNTKQTLHEL